MDPYASKRVLTFDQLLLRLSALKEKVTRLEEKVRVCRETSLKSAAKSQQKR
jgi:hypothetical protein